MGKVFGVRLLNLQLAIGNRRLADWFTEKKGCKLSNLKSRPLYYHNLNRTERFTVNNRSLIEFRVFSVFRPDRRVFLSIHEVLLLSFDYSLQLLMLVLKLVA